MFRRRLPVFALSLGCAGVAGWSMARDGDAEAADPQPALAPAPPASAEAVDPSTGPGDGDLLARARASIEGGEVDPTLLDALGRSEDPRHAHAYRLLVAQTPDVTPKSPGRAEAPEQPEATVAVTAPAAQSETPSTDAGPDQPDEPDTAEADGPISVLTSMKLERIGSVVALTLQGSDTVDVGIVAQGDTDKDTRGPKTRRFVVEAAGALPTFLQARPELEGVRVKDVRRGDKTVQLEIELDPGWKVSVRSKLDNGFRITFRSG